MPLWVREGVEVSQESVPSQEESLDRIATVMEDAMVLFRIYLMTTLQNALDAFDRLPADAQADPGISAARRSMENLMESLS